MTLHTALWESRHWEKTTSHPEPPYQPQLFEGACGVFQQQNGAMAS
ncbi:hypothetical protein [Stenomitos frigidus]|nr:hypothetical protein [Stenomitos frigidus]